MSSNIPDELDMETNGRQVKFTIDGISTGWMADDDAFVKRIDKDSLNQEFLIRHLKKEIQIKNTLDDGIALFKSQKYPKAIERFDRVLFYDPEYGEALLYKSYSLRGQRHFVKAFRYYRRAVKADGPLKDVEYHKALLAEANDERSNFPKLKRNIYAGDEHFANGEFESAIESYDKALQNPSRFKQKILSKLLNKKAAAYLELEDFEEALKCFRQSLDVEKNDCAIFGEGLCEYRLNLDITPEFKGCLRISKRRMLTQAIALMDLGYAEESSRISGYLRENHFKEDDFYEKLVQLIG